MLEKEIDSPAFIKSYLGIEEWKNKKNTHIHLVDDQVGDYLALRSQHKRQPVMDFLFQYYSFRVIALKRWSPGFGVALEFTDSEELPELSELNTDNDVAFLDPSLFPENRIRSTRWILEMLSNTQNARPSFGCFGMHEWAMVYKTDDIRHNQVPMRMEPAELAEFVESRPLVCTHFDAFRFFTPDAVPLNKNKLTRETTSTNEQPGCIHANMDLYKWAFKLYPWIGSDLILEAFKLAVEARTIDMKASPYDLSEFGLEPIKIETESGRTEYREAQEAIFKKGIPVREKLIKEYEMLLGFLN